VRELVVEVDPAERTPTRTHDSIRESRMIGAEPEHCDEIANATPVLYANDRAASNMKSETLAAKAVEKTLRGKVQQQTFHTASTAAGYSLIGGLMAPTNTGRNGSLYHRR
jgi:hypothetical protein